MAARAPRAVGGRGRWRGRVRGLLPFVIAAAGGFLLAYAAVYLFVFPSRLVPDDRPVPDVRGQLAEDAERTLRDAGFASRIGAQHVNASLPAGTVSAQTPAPAVRRPRGATVVLDVAAEP